MATAYPLHWPDLWPRTERPTTSQFRSSLNAALNNVQDSLKRFAVDSGKKVENILISSNVTLGNMSPKESGVAVYFTWDGISTCIAVDRYQKIEDNLQAIHHCIEAERTKLRHGGINLVKAAFRGYAALPPPSGQSSRSWREVLELVGTVNSQMIEDAFRRLAKVRHPDAGGSTIAMAELNAARQQALKEI